MRSPSVVIPVFNAVDVSTRAILFLIRTGCEPSNIHVFNDASTDPRIAALKSLAEELGVGWIDQPENLGYTRNINAAFRSLESEFILLMNSDCLLRWDAAEEMAKVLTKHTAAAVVGPLSNHAGSQSVAFRSRRDWLHLDDDEIEDDVNCVSSKLRSRYGRRPFAIPTVNGFCAVWRRAFLEEIDFFDEVNFPRGYGEEDDACIRLGAKGRLCLVAPWLFAVHFKTQSFTLTERSKNKAVASELLSKLHGANLMERVLANFDKHPLLRNLRKDAVDD